VASEILVRYLEGDQNTQEPGEFHRCADYFARALTIAPDAAYDEGRQLFCSGRELVFGGDYSGATSRLLRAIRIDPGRPYAYNALGIAKLEQARFEEAIGAFREAIRLAPYWAYPRHNLALRWSAAGMSKQWPNTAMPRPLGRTIHTCPTTWGCFSNK
jgi:Flp pilus assembly protein TadD